MAVVSAYKKSEPEPSVSSLILVEFHLFDVDLTRSEAPVFALIVFVTIQAPPADPLSAFEASFLYGSDANSIRLVRTISERDAESFSSSQEFIRPHDHHKAKAIFRETAEDLI